MSASSFTPDIWKRAAEFRGDKKLAHNDTSLWLDQFPFPKREDDKYLRGTALIYGSAAMTGAARLAARAAQRIGAGSVLLGAPKDVVKLYAETLESVIVSATDTIDTWKELLADKKRNAILIGPGLGRDAKMKDYVLAALETRKPCVLDADALSNFADIPDEFLDKLHSDCVITPHEGEFARLFGTKISRDDGKLSRVRKAAEISRCVVLLKGAETYIANPSGDAVVNDNAPPSLATAGAGDVLAGMILGLVAQNMGVFSAAAAAAWIHGKVAANFGLGLIAEDLINGIPAVLKDLSGALARV